MGNSSASLKGSAMDPAQTPEAIWSEIFFWLDVKSLDAVHRTCRFFKLILSRQVFWVEKCERDGVGLPPLPWRPVLREHIDYRLVYIHRPFYRNLVPQLAPGTTLEELQQTFGWKVKRGGDGPVIEAPPVFCEQRDDVPVCIATSYHENWRLFSIDFSKLGISDWVLDKVRPIVTISELCCPRHDCASKYKLEVTLAKSSERFSTAMRKRGRFVEKEWPQWSAACWEECRFELDGFVVGIRKLFVKSAGVDRQFWAGPYGSKFANTSVVLSFPDEVRLREDNEPDEDDAHEGTHDSDSNSDDDDDRNSWDPISLFNRRGRFVHFGRPFRT